MSLCEECVVLYCKGVTTVIIVICNQNGKEFRGRWVRQKRDSTKKLSIRRDSTKETDYIEN